MFPLSTVAFPSGQLPLHVFEDRYRALVGDILDPLTGSREFGTVLISAGAEVGGGERRTDVGCLLRVEMAVPFEDGRWLVVTQGIERIRVLEWLDDDPYPRAVVEAHPSSGFDGAEEQLGRAAAAVRRARMLQAELDDGPCCPIDLELGEDPDVASWAICALAPLGLLDAQRLLEETHPSRRLDLLVELLRERIGDLEALLGGTAGQ